MRTRHDWWFAALLGLTAWFYFWCADALVPRWLEPYTASYYGYETHALLSGQLHLELQPAPELLKLPDPYDPAANGPYRVHDMTFYQGRYYLYFGIAPVLTLGLPWAILTGTQLTENFLVAAFGVLGFAAALALLRSLHRGYFPRAPFPVVLACGALLAFGNTVPALMQAPGFYQVPMASAYFFGMLAFYFVFRAFASPRRAPFFIGIASAAWGLAVAARPNYLFGAGIVALPLWLKIRSLKWRDYLTRDALPWTLSTVLPIGAVGAGIMVHNYLRFGSPGEFGMKYQLAGFRIIDQVFMGTGFIIPNLKGYLFALPQWERHFPFVLPGTGQLPLGALSTAPFLWFGVLGLARLAWKGGRGWRDSDWISAAAGTATLGLMLFLGLYFSMVYRYATDFIVWLAIWSTVEVLIHAADERAWLRRAASVGAVLLAAFSIATGLAYAARKFPDQPRLSPLARVLDLPAYAWDRARDNNYGPLRLRIQFPAYVAARTEPLVGTGAWAEESDVVFVRYLDRGHVQFGLFQAGIGGPISAPIPIDYDRPHEIRIFAGSFAPPAESGQFRGWSPLAIAGLQHQLEIQCDGETVLAAAGNFFAAAPERLAVGGNPLGLLGIEKKFSGSILAAERQPIGKPGLRDAAFAAGQAAELQLWFPFGRPGATEPVLLTGSGGASDLLFVRYLPDSRVAFGLDHFGKGGPSSESMRVDFNQPHKLLVWLGPFAGHSSSAPATAAQRGVAPLEERVALSLDGRWILDTRASFYPASLDAVAVGDNGKHGSSSPTFSGRVESIEPQPPDRLRKPVALDGGDPWTGFGDISMTATLPSSIQVGEPLVVTGQAGAGDLVYVRTNPAGRVIFGIDHWAVGSTEGRPVAVDFSVAHRIDIQMDALVPPGGSRDGRVVVKLDGATVLDASVKSYPAAANQIFIGENPIGGSTTAPGFTGMIDSVERKQR